jgi:adenine deaminase
MKSFFILLLVFAMVSCNAQPSNQETVFTKVNVIPMNEEKVIKNQDVVVQNGIITAIGESGKVKYGKNAHVIDANGKYLMPGLAEMHAHVPPVDDIEPMKEVLTLFLYNGITTIRGMLGHPRHLELRVKFKWRSLVRIFHIGTIIQWQQCKNS